MANIPQYPNQPPGPPQPPADVPSTVQNAVKLMYAGAAVSLIGFIISMATMGNMRDQVKAAAPTADAATVDAAVTVGLTVGVVLGLLGCGLWIWMAVMNQRGRNWARILSTVFFGFACLGLVSVFTSNAKTTLGLIGQVLVVLIGLGAIVMLWSSDSARHFAKHPGMR